MRKILYFAVLITSLLLSACGNNLTSQTSSNDTNTVMTVVALTLTAMPSASPTTVPEIASTPEPIAAFTPTPAPTTLRVVYSRAGEIWIWNQGAEPLKLSNSGIDIQPRISSDGKIVVFARNNELYAINPDGSNLRKIVSKEYLSQYRPQDHKWIWADYYDWMLDTHILYFTTVIQLDNQGFPIYQFDLHRVNVDTGEVSIVLSAGQGGVPYFSPNGRTIAMAQLDSINLVNVDGSDWRTALSFELPLTYNGWKFIPSVVPLPDGNGFRVIVPAHVPLGNPDELSEFWHIPMNGEAVLLNTFMQSGFPQRTISPGGNSLLFSRKDAENVPSLCLYQHDIAQETCIPKPDKEVYPSGWALNDSKYNFEALNWVLDNGNFVYDTTYYVSVVAKPNEAPLEIDAYVWLAWVSPDQYVYIDQDWNLHLATFGGSSITIHNGVKNPASQDGILPFDFSTR